MDIEHGWGLRRALCLVAALVYGALHAPEVVHADDWIVDWGVLATTSATVSGQGGACLGVPGYAEARPENKAANLTRAARPAWRWNDRFAGSFRTYYEQVAGDCQGTTEQILEWVARKWGFDRLGYPDLAKAMAVGESSWRQSEKGDNERGVTNYGERAYPDGYQSFGILQVKRTVWPGSWPMSEQSTAYNADYAMAVVRMHYDGQSWLGAGTKGSIANSVAAWFCGCGDDGNGSYAQRFLRHYQDKPWIRERPRQPAEPAAPAEQAACTFVLGFKALRDLLPDLVGDCIEDEWHNPDNGDTLQRTTGGLLVWRKADNWTAFTDGRTTWINGPFGLQNRANQERFPWEAP